MHSIILSFWFWKFHWIDHIISFLFLWHIWFEKSRFLSTFGAYWFRTTILEIKIFIFIGWKKALFIIFNFPPTETECSMRLWFPENKPKLHFFKEKKKRWKCNFSFFTINQIVSGLKTLGKLEMLEKASFQSIKLNISNSSICILNHYTLKIGNNRLFRRVYQMYHNN